MLLPWQWNFWLWQKFYLALLHITMDPCTKFQVNWSKTEWGVWSTRFLHEFHSKNAVAMATHFSTLTKSISCTSTYHYGPMYQISSQLIKNWVRSLIYKIFAWISFKKCCCHGNTFLDFDEKYILHFYISLWTHVPNFESIDQKLKEEFDPQDFAWISVKKCCYHGNTFLDFDEKYILHLYISLWTHVPNFKSIDQKLREEFDPQDSATDRPTDRPPARPPDRPTARPHGDSYIPPYTPCVWRGDNKRIEFMTA